MYAVLWPAHARVQAFGWHRVPMGPKMALRAYPQNFVTEPHTLRLLYIEMLDCLVSALMISKHFSATNLKLN